MLQSTDPRIIITTSKTERIGDSYAWICLWIWVMLEFHILFWTPFSFLLQCSDIAKPLPFFFLSSFSSSLSWMLLDLSTSQQHANPRITEASVGRELWSCAVLAPAPYRALGNSEAISLQPSPGNLQGQRCHFFRSVSSSPSRSIFQYLRWSF